MLLKFSKSNFIGSSGPIIVILGSNESQWKLEWYVLPVLNLSCCIHSENRGNLMDARVVFFEHKGDRSVLARSIGSIGNTFVLTWQCFARLLRARSFHHGSAPAKRLWGTECPGENRGSEVQFPVGQTVEPSLFRSKWVTRLLVLSANEKRRCSSWFVSLLRAGEESELHGVHFLGKSSIICCYYLRSWNNP